MNFLVAFNLLFLVCNAQENIKCFRSEERLTPIPPSTQQTLNQGVPGKRGPVGMKGDTGSDGMKGEKGAAGVPDRSAIESLRGELRLLQELVDTLNASNKEIRRTIIGTENTWYSPLNGFQYKATPNVQSWGDSRQVCRNWGSDLAVHGVQTMASRLSIIHALSLPGQVWIGGSDEETEGTWKWVNGNIATDEQLLWESYQPDNAGNNEDCLEMRFPSPFRGRSNDRPCPVALTGLCEKTV